MAGVRRAFYVVLAACSSSDPSGSPDLVCGDGFRDPLELCDDGNLMSGDGCDRFCQLEPIVTVTWAFYPMLDGPAQAGCRAGVAAIEIVTESDTTKTYPCDDGRTGTVHLQFGKLLFVRLRGPAGEIIAESLPGLPSNSSRVDAPFYEDAGYIRASFASLSGCASLALTIAGAGPAHPVDELACGDGKGIAVSAPIRAGTYDIEFSNALGDRFAQPGVTVGANNRVTDLVFP